MSHHSTIPETKMGLEEKVFTKLLSDEAAENRFCCDCGSKLQDSSLNYSGLNTSCFDSIYVSINNGIFLCSNCAYIHQANYGVEISFVKKLMNDQVITESQSSIYASSANNESQNKVKKLSKWTYTQLRVLIIAGGNRAFREYMDQYDLMNETI